MEQVTREAWIEGLKAQGSHSNHPVVLLSPHDFDCVDGRACFASRRALGCRVLACDPLVTEERLEEALRAYDDAHHDAPMVFAGVSEPTARALKGMGFTVVKIGEEPWVDLGDHAPRGNRGKGIRAARNQALRAGCGTEEWDRSRFLAAKAEVQAVFDEWRGLTLLSLEGGVLGTDPFADLPGRRYFVTRREGRLEAILVATAIRPGHSYYLEDLVYRRDAFRGVQELTTLAALDALALSGARMASLGLVFMRKLERGGLSDEGLEVGLARLQRVLGWFYNAEGQDLFRKRFQIARWEGAYFALRGPRPRPGVMPRFSRPLLLGWGLLAVLATLEPTLRFPWRSKRP